MRTPIAQATAPIVATLELVGGIALINGVLVRPIAALLTRNILGALLLVHASIAAEKNSQTTGGRNVQRRFAEGSNGSIA